MAHQKDGPSSYGKRPAADNLEARDGALAPGSTKKGRHANHGYARGAVTHLRAHNFMTFVSEVDFEMGPDMNLIIGPNGSGKSSFVAALCLGLGGNHKVFSRDSVLSGFIHRDKQAGWTEVTLSGGPGKRDHVVRREMTRVERQSKGGGHDAGGAAEGQNTTWKLDGVVVKADRIKALIVGDLNVDFSNLCQFMPQGKVTVFAGMDPTELLTATEKCIEDGTMLRQHQELVQLRHAAKQADARRAVTSSGLEQLKTLDGREQRDYDKIRKRKQLEEEIEMVKRKQLWMEVAAKQQLQNAAAEETAAAKALVRARQQEVTADDGPTRRKDVACKAAELDLKQEVKGGLAEGQRALAKSTAMKAEQESLDELVLNRAHLAELSHARRREIARWRRSVVDLEAEAHAATQATNAQGLLPAEVERVAQLTQQRPALEEEVAQLEFQAEEGRQREYEVDQDAQQLDAVMQRFADVRHLRLQRLERRSPGIVQLYHWVQANQQHFERQVLGPIALEIQNVIPAHAGALEQQLGKVLLWFVVATRNDEVQLSRHLKTCRGCRGVVVACFDGNPDVLLPHPADLAMLGQYGITHSLDQVFEAPNIVKHVMANFRSINKCYLGTGQTDSQAVLAELATRNVRMVYTPASFYTSGTSQYNRDAKHSTSAAVGPPSLLASGADGGDEAAQRQHTEHKLRERRGELLRVRELLAQQHARVQGKRDELRALCAKLLAIKERGKAVAASRGKLRGRLTANNNKVLQLEATPDPSDQEPAIAADMQACMDRLLLAAAELCDTLAAQFVSVQTIAALTLKHKELEMQKEAMQRASQHARAAVADAQKRLAHVAALETTARAAKDQAHDRAMQSGGQPDANTQAAFRALFDAPAELQGLLEELEQAAADVVGNAVDVAAYLERQRRIVEVAADLVRQDAALALLNTDMGRKKGAWLPALEAVVEQLNRAFGGNLAQMGCAGEVKLQEHEDYDQYALQIWVKFRPEMPLQMLKGSYQYGGEQAVSTTLFLLALQSVARMAFRVVDEINQGLDSLNERTIFGVMARNSGQPGAPQCFMLTPKLLSGLPLESPHIRVHNLMSGGHISRGLPALNNQEEGMYGRRFFNSFPAMAGARDACAA